jgi:PAS domain S-box-containing protein
MKVALDADGYFAPANPALSRALGWAEQELVSVPFWEFVHPDEQHEFVEEIEQLMSGAAPALRITARTLARDGTYRPTKWAAEADGNTGTVHITGLDPVCDGASVNGAASPDRVLVGHWEWLPEADSLTWSPEMRRLFGLADGVPVAYREILEHVHPVDRASVDRAVQRSLTTGEPYVDDFRVVHDDGRIHHVHAAGRKVTRAGQDGSRLFGIARENTPYPRA